MNVGAGASRPLHPASAHFWGAGLLRRSGLGSVTLRTKASTWKQFGEALMRAWPHGRILAVANDRVSPPDDMSWLDRQVEPPEQLIKESRCVLVSFFHGEHVDLYSPGMRDELFEPCLRASSGGLRGVARWNL